MSVTENIFNSMFDKLEKFLKTETVVGEPFVVGNITFVPIISATFGLAGGSGEGKKGADGDGSGGGLGCKITPNAVLVIKGEEVNLIPLNNKGSLEKIIDMVPEIIKKIDFEHNCKKEG
jgi:uncharacterized spore protein YtfJ